MEIKLNRLTLSNFKGVRDFTFDPNGQNCTVRGQNGAGKTTLSDAAHWLLFGKDSTGRADFAIKTLDAQGQELHNLDHSAEAVLEIDGRPITLKKVYREKYTKKRGSPRAEFTGNETQYFVDGVPLREKEWQYKIGSIIAEDTFKLLTNPAHFCGLHWQKRREILLQVCGNVSDRDVLESAFPTISDKDAYTTLVNILNQRTLDDHKKIVAAQKKEINKRLIEIPARIDEAHKSIADVSGYNVKQIEHRLQYLNAAIQEALHGSTTATLRKQKADLEAKKAEIQGKLDGLKREAEKVIDLFIEEIETKSRATSRALKETVVELAAVTAAIDRNAKEMERLRGEFTEIAAQEYTGLNICFACGQALPENQIQSATEKHNAEQARKLAEINAQGKCLKTANADSLKIKERLEERKTVLESETAASEAKLQAAKDQKPLTLANVGKLEKKAIIDLQTEITEIGSRINENAPVDTIPLETERSAEQGKLAALDHAAKTTARIETLKDEEKKLATEYEELERQTFLMEKFTVAKVGLLEGKINSRFSLVRWKLFETQVNGGISDVCEATVSGVPFSSANTGSQILAGLDIIATLQKHYGIKAVCWLDHRESLTTEPQMDCQLISLVADPDCKGLIVGYN